MPADMVPFLLVVAVLTITPGPDMALVLRNGTRGGAPAAWWTGLGCCAGIAVHACAAVIGLSALLTASAAAFNVIKLAGAIYLVYLGASALWHARKNIPAASGEQTGSPTPMKRGVAFRQGLLSNTLNPKIALLFLTLLPQFVAKDEPRLATTVTLAVIFLALAVVWWRMFSLLVAVLGSFLSRPRVRTVFERATGTVLVALGLRVATD